MLSREDNETLCRVGPGTRMGRAMRRYWHPIAASAQVAKPDGAPLRTKLLGEKFVVFRDSAGKVGVLNEYCMHRGVSLALGRVEEGGIRCLYHGWKFAVDGTLLETPNHPDPRLCQALRAPAYPVREVSGLIWTYIGPAAQEPPFRRFGYDEVPASHRVIHRVNVTANYLQLAEGGVDSSHVGILHTNQVRPSWRARRHAADAGVLDAAVMEDNAPRLEIEDTPFGYHYAAIRDAMGEGGQSGLRNVRVTPVILPTLRVIPATFYYFSVFETPMDDVSTATYVIAHADRPISYDDMTKVHGLDDPRFWSPEDCWFRTNWDERLGQDRDSMNESWTGHRGIQREDVVMAMSQERILDRSVEHLVAADQAVVRLRRRMMDMILLEEAGEPPPGLMIADLTKILARDQDIAATDRWQDLAPEHRAFATAAE
ncbi:MAG TPA: Rieske 2Fe-2S domain-containing protein [Stellaceae bacterium]|jgi:phenylpropionate dioxygenase-like ring-hydroxylating dioxygenase large terminal subunit|nr:Rieske 2Fe-2S domain-containing protein [Stellaceae bacterium]